MGTIDEILNEGNEPEVAAVEPEPTPEPEQTEAPAAVRDEKGRFAPKGETESASPAPVEEPKLDHAAIVAERRRRQEAETRAQTLEQELQQLRNPPAPPPSVFEDEQGWQDHFGAQVTQQAAFNARLDTSEMLASQNHDDFDEMKDKFLAMAQANPALGKEASSNPLERAQRRAKDRTRMGWPKAAIGAALLTNPGFPVVRRQSSLRWIFQHGRHHPRTGLVVQQWEDKFFTEYLHDGGFKSLMGTDENAVIQVKEDLTKKQGDSITVALVNRLTNAATTGTTVLEGNEEDMSSRSMRIYVDKRRNAVRIAEMSEQKSAISLRQSGRATLLDWAMEDTRDLIITALGSLNGTAFLSRTAAIGDAWLVDNLDRVYFGAGVGSGTDLSADLAQLDTTNDLFNTARWTG
jgi:hypothetical protein